jgi:hypothetical protein
MICSVAFHRRLGPWLIGLYALAIVGGFLPLVTSYSAHCGSSWTITQANLGTDSQERQHHFGDADDAVHHHVLQDLTGTAAWLPEYTDVPVVHIAIPPTAPPPLTDADAVRLERPPKHHLSV